MNYDRIIIELMDRVSRLEEEMNLLKSVSSVSDCSPIISSGRDKTKYMINGVKYGKSRLALAIVNEYLKRNPDCTASDLFSTFDKSLQGALGVIRPLTEVKEKYSQPAMRFFCKADEIIHTNDGDCVVCSQWSSANIQNLIIRADQLGITVLEIKKN